jgi:ribonuclease T2
MTIRCMVVMLGLCVAAAAQRCGPVSGTPGAFDYYVLALSWAPGFCDTARHPTARECSADRHLGFVVHGLWPQVENGRSPEGCTPARPVAHNLVDRMLAVMPDAGLIQHEWACHGTCSGMSAQDYFGLVDRAFQSVRIPDDFRAPRQEMRVGVADVERRFADANRVSPDAFRAVCHEGELVEVRVCMTKDLRIRACSASVRDCPARRLVIAPVP